MNMNRTTTNTPPYGAPLGPAPRKTKWYTAKRFYLGLGTGLIVGLLMGSCGGSGNGSSGWSSGDSAPAPTVTVTAPAPAPVTVTAPAAPAAPATSAPAAPAAGTAKTSFGDGTWMVGSDKDIKPGKYKVVAEGSCYWERLSGTSGTFDDIVANENVSQGSQAVVTIAASDEAFKSQDCGTWTKVG